MTKVRSLLAILDGNLIGEMEISVGSIMIGDQTKVEEIHDHDGARKGQLTVKVK